jgi:pre-mRNA-splicing factor ISY1
LNDEINNLLREKRHFETQIVNLGGANYKRGNASMLDDDGKEVPGTRGYKYFGRARELPGVKEMFSKSSKSHAPNFIKEGAYRIAQQATEESARNASFQMFRNQGPEYYGDFDEADEALAKEEEEASKAGESSTLLYLSRILIARMGRSSSTYRRHPTTPGNPINPLPRFIL